MLDGALKRRDVKTGVSDLTRVEITAGLRDNALLAVGAIAVASAVLLILDLSNPYRGVFRASPAPLEQVLALMGK